MKKILLSMAAAVFGISAVCAEEVTLDLSTATGFDGTFTEETLKDDGSLKAAAHYQPINAFEISGYKFTAAQGGNKSNAPAFYLKSDKSKNSIETFRLYAQNTFTITAPEGVEMTQIVFSLAANKNKGSFSSETGACTHDADKSNLVITWDGQGTVVNFTSDNTIQVKAITVTTGSTDKETLALPTFDPASGASFAEQLAVSISAAEGATVYYTLDGTAPTTASDKYESPIVLTATTTVKAYAVKEGMNDSGVATAVYTKDVVAETLSDIIIAGLDGDETTEFTYGGEATVTYVNGNNMYIQDATAAMLVYGKLNTTYEPGDVLSGFKGTFKDYYSTYELMANAASFGEPVKRVDVEPIEFTIATLTPTDQNKYIILKDVTVDSQALTLKKGDDEIEMYNKFKVEIPATETAQDVAGILSYYQAKGDDAPKLQVYPLTFRDAVSIKAVEAEEGVRVENGTIVAPAGAEVYSISGARVNGHNLQSGVYVVRTAGKAVKVFVK